MSTILNGLLFWELRQVMQIEKWKEAHSADLPRWIEAIGAIDAYCSLATFSYNHPDYIYPQITSQSFHLQAEALGHPLMNRNNVSAMESIWRNARSLSLLPAPTWQAKVLTCAP